MKESLSLAEVRHHIIREMDQVIDAVILSSADRGRTHDSFVEDIDLLIKKAQEYARRVPA